MTIAIISDIHANLEALEEMLSILRTRHFDEVICLGDIVGYGANPNECLKLVRELTPHILLGNHDRAAVDLSATESFTPNARASARWTYGQVTEENKQFIATLPYTLERHELFFVHSSPYQPEEWHYILNDADARDNFEHYRQGVCFVGHSHEAVIFSKKRFRTEGILRGEKYIINVGSVGQPRDGDWRLSFGIFATEEWRFENVRAEYDVRTASDKILKAGLPLALAERLFVGR